MASTGEREVELKESKVKDEMKESKVHLSVNLDKLPKDAHEHRSKMSSSRSSISKSSKNSLDLSSETSARSAKKNAKREIISILLDIPIVLFAILFIIFGVILGVILYAVLSNAELDQAASIVADNSAQLYHGFSAGIKQIYTQMYTLQSFMMESGNPSKMSLEQFSRFTVNSGVMGNNVVYFQYLQKVLDSQRSGFNDELKSIYMDTPFPANYSMFDRRLANGTAVVNTRSTYYPIKLVVPLIVNLTTSIGYNVDSDVLRKDGLETSLAIKDVAATTVIFLRLNSTGNVIFVTVPVWNYSDPTQVFGVIRGTVKVDNVLNNLLQGDYTEVLVQDLLANQIVAQSNDFNTSSIIGQVVKNTTVGTRPWSITFRPNAHLLKKISDADFGKWLGLFLPIGISVLTSGFIVAFLIIKRLHFQKMQQKNLSEKIDLLKESAEHLEMLMEKISHGEQLSRSILRSIPLPVFTVDEDGLIHHTNPCFEDEFIMNTIDQEKVHITKVFPVFEQLQQFEDYISNSSNEHSILLLTNKFNQSKRFNLIRSKQMISVPKNVASKKRVKLELSIIVLQYVDLDDLVKPFSTKKSISNVGKEVVDRSMIYQILNDSNLLQEFKSFCAQEQNEENVMLLEDIKAYRQLNKVAKRIEKQEEMKKKYLMPDSSHALNLPQKVLEKQREQLHSGRMDDFDELEMLVMNILSQDSLQRYLQSKQSNILQVDK